MAPMTRAAIKREPSKDIKLHNTFEELTILRQKSRTKKKKNDDEGKHLSCNSNTSNELILRYGVRGLINLGSTCYINSVIQAFIHTPPLCNYFFTENHSCNGMPASTCQMCALLNVFREYNADEVFPAISLQRLLYLVWQEAPHLAEIEQQDAHEFYLTYIQLLHLSCSQSDENFLYISNNNISDPTPCNCIIDQLYAGLLESNLTCLNCGGTSPKREVFYDISLGLGANKIENLYACLENYTKSENLGEHQCSSCSSNQEFIKKLYLVVLPKVLNISFKRFTQHLTKKGSKQKKLTTHVIFPFELDMKSFARDNSGDADNYVYSLFAVIRHAGSMNSGHYTVYIKKAQDIWFLCNDNVIKAVTPESVLSTQAYMLVYLRKTLNYQ